MTFVAATPAGALSNGRAYELVSPPDKNGGDVTSENARTRAAAGGDAVGFMSLQGFADSQGSGIGFEYLSQRSPERAPGDNGWDTHGITPPQAGMSYRGVAGQLETVYYGDFTPDLTRGIVHGWSPLTADLNVKDVTNLYRRADLRTPGAGVYDLLTGCPLCETTSAPLPPLPEHAALAFELMPTFANASRDLDRVVFESKQRLTDDLPAQDPGRPRLYSWEDGTVRLAGRIPTAPAIECDDAGSPVCAAADVSLAGPGAGSNHGRLSLLHTVSDGSDGHSRIFFTRPTNNGTRLAAGGAAGHLYMRVDHTSTAQLNASENAVPSGFSPARYLDASADGRRAFFMTSQALTNGAPTAGTKLYMYDTTKPASAPDNLALVSVDSEGADGANVLGAIGASDDGRYLYFVAAGQLVRGEEVLGITHGIYLWHDGAVTYIGYAPMGTPQAEILAGNDYTLTPRESRVTPDGKHLLFSTTSGDGLVGYDHGSCATFLGVGCRELYVYSADSDELACASCNPSGAPATEMATTFVRQNTSASQTTFRQTRTISEDGAHVFFSTAEALVPEDVNRKIDAYEYDVANRGVHLLTSGKSTSDSWFLDASADGKDAFFLTREPLVGWDVDGAYDIYDARVGGGFPEPERPSLGCLGDACQGAPGMAPGVLPSSSSLFSGTGNVSEKVRPRPRRCRRGFVKKRVRGRVKCVRRTRRAARRSRKAHVQRRGS